MSFRSTLILALPFAALVTTTASEREFTYVYDSAVAAPGTKRCTGTAMEPRTTRR
jgi:hypothetical protein